MIRLALKPLARHENLVSAPNRSFRTEFPPRLPENVRDINRRSQIDVDDWDRLFYAVECRLSTSVTAAYQDPDKTRTTVLECVEALDQLHHALTRERQQRSQSK
jgi:hypothetical protein